MALVSMINIHFPIILVVPELCTARPDNLTEELYVSISSSARYEEKMFFDCHVTRMY